MVILYYHSIIASVFFSLFLGIYTLLSGRSSYLNRSFFRLALLLCLVSSATYFAVTAGSVETSRKILNTSSVLWFFFPLVFLKFIVAFTEKRLSILNRFLTASVVLPVILFLLMLKYNQLFMSFRKTDYGWSHVYNTHSLLFIITLCYYILYFTAAFILLIVWRRRRKGTIHQRQADVILLSTLLLFISVLTYRKIFVYYFHSISPPLFPVLLNVWLGAVAYTILKFHLMSNISRMVQSTILSHISDMVIILDTRGTVTFVNERTLKITGFAREDIMYHTTESIFPDLPLDTEYSKETSLRTKTGESIPVLLTMEAFKDSQGFLLSYIITASDIRILNSLQRQIQEKEYMMLKLKESEKKYSRVFNVSPAGLVFFHIPDGSVLEINSMALRIAGYEKGEILGMNVFFNSILVNNTENRKLVHDIVNGEPILSRNCTILKKDHTKRTILVSIGRLDLKGDPCLLLACSDITDSQKIKAQLIRAQKLDSIGILAGGIAHDFNNMLAIIQGNISLSLSETNNADVQMFLQDALKAGSNAANLTSQLLAFSRGKKSEKSVIDIREVINSSIVIAFSGKDASPVFYSDAENSMVVGNTIQLQQIFINLFINAIQASDNSGEITISTTNDREKKDIIISVTDFGKGIPEKDIDTIFDPFFSTKAEGTGLGLSIVYAVVNNHHGTIEVTSSVQEGTTFTITFPLVYP